MTSNFRRSVTVLAVMLAILTGCTSKSGEPADAGQCNVTGLPQFTTTCTSCHDVASLGKAQSDETAGPREWMAAQGKALLQVDPAFPAPGMMLGSPWKHRGRHNNAEMDPASCSGCHPTRSDGMGHGTRTYPASVRSKPFLGGANCAGVCHVWLKGTVVSRGFEDASGKIAEYGGSARPDEMLTAVSTAHQKLWVEGYRSESAALRIAVLNPGCGACHHPQDESHGSTPSCLTCHSFGGAEGATHLKHQDLASTWMAKLDARHPDMTGCAYCHYESEGAASRSNAVCYNCHLSGHQPLDASGKAHFWPAEQ